MWPSTEQIALDDVACTRCKQHFLLLILLFPWSCLRLRILEALLNSRKSQRNNISAVHFASVRYMCFTGMCSGCSDSRTSDSIAVVSEISFEGPLLGATEHYCDF